MFGTVLYNSNPYEYGPPTYENYFAMASQAYAVGRGPRPMDRATWNAANAAALERAAAAAAAAAAQQAWVADRATGILAACPVAGWPGRAGGEGVIPCSLDEATRRAHLEWMLAHQSPVGVMAEAVPVKTQLPLPPSEVSSVNTPAMVDPADHLTAPMMMSAGGGVSPLVYLAAGAGILWFLSRRGGRK